MNRIHALLGKSGIWPRMFLVLVFVCTLTLVAVDLFLRAGTNGLRSPDATDTDAERRITETVSNLAAKGARMTNAAQWDAARYLVARCRDEGYRVWVQEYRHKGQTWPNVIASRAPILNSGAEIVLFMAHFDSVSKDPQGRAPGVNDNGSGVAVLLEAARALRDSKPPVPLFFCFFSNEEVHGLGSKAFVSWARREGLRIRAAVNVDVVGYNRPSRLLDWSAVTANASWRSRARAFAYQLRNGFLAVWYGNDALLVAGRLPNATLAAEVADGVRGGGSLAVKMRVRDDCG